RGFRIELGEIERALLDQPEVRQAAAVLRDDPQVGKRLVAYLVLEVSGVDAPGEPAAAPVEALRGRLAQRLPAYMLPAALVALPALPVDANGKLDRRALAALPPPGRDGAGPAAGRPAQDELEAALCRLWAETLGAAAVGVDDDFFALGGHSLLAVRLFQRVEKSFGVRLPLAGLFARPTVEHMAQQLRAALQPDGEPGGAPQARQPLPTLVTIQPGEGRPVFFCVHNFGGAVLDLQPLSQAIGADQPFYGLQARGLEGECDPHTTIEEMAADYLAAVRQQQPHGPYYLGGFCFGGVVAYEMAMRLQALGEPVALLAAIDAYAPGWSRIDSPLSPAQAVAFFTNLPHWLHNYRELAPWERRVVVRRRWKRVTAGLRRLLGKPAELTTLEIIGEHTHVLEAPDYRRRLMELHLQALQAYHTPRYDGTVTVYRVRGMPLFTRHRFDLGWGRVARQVELKIVPGAHHNLLFQPYVDGLGAAIRQSIDEN
ncbi:MAG: thioesterase domain-containing protein, partial [Chloroflexota bacterium]